MKEKDISEKLLKYYKEHFEKAPKHTEEALIQYLKDKGLAYGICSTAISVFDEDIFETEWVKAYCNGFLYWGRLPILSTTVDEILESLQLRIDKLEERVKVVKKQRREEKKTLLSSL